MADRRCYFARLGDDLRARFAWGSDGTDYGPRVLVRDSTEAYECATDMWWGLDNNFIVQPQLVSLLGRADLSARAQVTRAPGDTAEWVLFGGSLDFDFTTCELSIHTSHESYINPPELAARLWLDAGFPHLGRFLEVLNGHIANSGALFAPSPQATKQDHWDELGPMDAKD
ncbi:hypothetical protein B0H14DRAFT_2725304 [Mycena olivaceomarginata]|nr:hypothetical protein B0H14DRAFT_2725304 [Mycena olivaceomarginata]